MTRTSEIQCTDISEASEGAGYLLNVGDFMLLFSMVAGTSLLAQIVYGGNEFSAHNVIEAGLQIIVTLVLLAYIPLLNWRGYNRNYWITHACLGGILAFAIASGIIAVLIEGWTWSLAGIIAFGIFLLIWLGLFMIPFGFFATAINLLLIRLAPNDTSLVEMLERPSSLTSTTQNHPSGRFRLLGVLLTWIGAIGILAFIAAFTLYGFAEEADTALADAAADWFGALIFLFPLWAVMINLGRRLKIPEASRLLDSDQRAPILLLRSFNDDPKTIQAKGLATRVLSLGIRGKKKLESAITEELAAIGPFIAIGKPGEKLPPLGAARSYLKDDEWQQAVGEWIAKARLIVMIAGLTHWVQWELRQILQTGQLNKLLVLLPPGDLEDRKARLRLLADSVGTNIADLPENRATDILALGFENNNTDSQKPNVHIKLIESRTQGQVDYELAIRIAIWNTNRQGKTTNPSRPTL